MNEEYLARAREKVDDVRMFIVGVSRRARELSKPGAARVLVKLPPNSEMSPLDIALLEVAEGKIVIRPGDKKN